jgi:hypothetical protein
MILLSTVRKSSVLDIRAQADGVAVNEALTIYLGVWKDHVRKEGNGLQNLRAFVDQTSSANMNIVRIRDPMQRV